MTTALPELVGSEKQIAWATEIRERGLAGMRKSFAAAIAARPAAADVLNSWVERVEAQTNAGWWIDNRSYFETAHEPALMGSTPLGRTIKTDVRASLSR
jgi:hypothetical protein